MQWLAEICVKRPVFATMLILSLVVVGAFSFMSLGVDLFPKIDFPTITVTVVNPGASPEEIETEITEKIEEAVNTISGIDELRSSSIEGVSRVFVQFLLEKDVEVAFNEVQQKVQAVIPRLPATAEQPNVIKLDTDAAPVLRITVSAPRSLRDVTQVAKTQIKERIESVSGVGQITIVGGQERQVNVWVDPDRMRSFNISSAEVAGALRIQNVEFPSGRLDKGQQETSVRTLGKVQRPEQFADVVVATRGNYQVKVRDIGHVEDGAEEIRSEARLNGQPAVTLIVAKQSGQNTVAVAREIKERLAEIEPTLPEGFEMRIIGDNSIFIENSVAALEEHLILGSIFASIVVFFFLWSFRSTFIAALAIPTSIISTFALMYAMGYTLNSITMLALTLMVGIVIDDAIIVLENIFRFVEEKGMPPFQAAIEGTRDIGLAVLATTLSLMAVFVPIGFMQGIVGRFMSSFGLTASFAVGVSLIVSFTLTPMLAARMIKHKRKTARSDDAFMADVDGGGKLENNLNGTNGEQPLSKESRWFSFILNNYTAALRFAMAYRWVIVTLCLVVFLSTIPLFIFVGKNFLPVDDQSQFEVSVRAPEGLSLGATSLAMERIATEIRRLPGVTDTLVTAGGGQDLVVNSGTIYVKLTDIKERSKSQEQIMSETRELLAGYDDLRTAVQQVAAFSGGGFRNANVQFLIAGPDLGQLEQYSEKILERMRAIPDAVDVDSTLISGKPELQLEINRELAADLGVRVGDISQALNTLVAGQDATTFNEGTEQFDVVVRAINPFRTSEEGLKRMVVPSSKLGLVTLDRLVTAKPGTGPSSIERTNRQRQVTLLANTRPGGSAASITSAIDSYVRELSLPSEYRTGYVGQSKEMGRAGFYFLLAFVLSFVFMYIVLAAQFESFIHPVTILLTLPLAIPFGILALLITGQSVNIFSGLGLLLLFGIVKKNAILQIDHTNNLRATGMSRYDAIIQANRDRLRPILMTTLALVAGMMPLTLSTGAGSGTNRSIGVLVVGGQTLCLLLTLLAVPVFYSIFDDLAEMRLFQYVGRFSEWLFGGVRRRFAAATGSIFGKN
ncbi:MAG TPA: efflux RND transporter permease subunit [Pyrinomonadaceae bacterium]|nr:efflux RND transporter permease subunit [Pyrinomonadaceae bacterium]HMP66473.1 efflux RND transporter permease subunit [Pyrinomonadaceae bacterium]